MGKKINEDSEVRQALGPSDPCERWVQEALYHMERSNLLSTSPYEVMGIIQGAIGKDWIVKKIESRGKIKMSKPEFHPLTDIIDTPSPKNICKLAEIALYLRNLYEVPNVADVIQMLKGEDQFDSALLQLGYGYRLLKIGATNIAFEPEADSGRKSDIIFGFKEKTFVAECYAPQERGKPYGALAGLLDFTLNRAFDLAEESAKIVSIALTIKTEPPHFTDQTRKHVEQVIHQIIPRIADRAVESYDSENFYLEIENFTGAEERELQSVFDERFAKEPEGKFQYGIRASYVPSDELKNSTRGVQSKGRPASLYFLSLPQSAPEDPAKTVDRLIDKVEKKVDQLRGHGTIASGIILMEHPVARRDNPNRMPFARLIKKKIVQGHDGIGFVAVLHRTFRSNHHPLYAGMYLDGTNQDAADLIHELNQYEGSTDILD